MIPHSPELDAALQALFDVYGEAGINELIGRIDGYGSPEDTASEWGGAYGEVGERSHISALPAATAGALGVNQIICVTGQPVADDEAEAQRQANIRYFNTLGVLGAYSGFDNDADGVDDRLRVPRQPVRWPPVGNGWPSFVQARKWADPSVAPSLQGAEPVDGVYIFKSPEAAVESLRLIAAALENGGVTV